jgi:acetyl-CoA C-acetyltransferase
MGQVLMANQANPARQAAYQAGVLLSTPATSVNKVRLSGLNTIYLADQMIARAGRYRGGGRHGEHDQRPVPAAGRPQRFRYGTPSRRRHHPRRPGVLFEAAHGGRHRAPCQRRAHRPRPPGRGGGQEQAAAAAIKDGRFLDEIVPVPVAQRKGDPLLVETDEGVRGDTTADTLAKLRPAFDKAGNITAGNASQISDGGAAVIVMSKAKAEALGAPILAEIVGYGQVAGPDASLLHQPSNAIEKALERSICRSATWTCSS